MHVEVTTDQHVIGSDALMHQLGENVEARLARFGGRITRVEVHLADENGAKTGPADKRCTLEARPAGQDPVAVTSHASTVQEATSEALRRLEQRLERRFGRLDSHKGADTVRRDEGH